MSGGDTHVSFNPTLVRLRLEFPRGNRRAHPRFQSHAGSIEALNVTQFTQSLISFQSHAGSIEAVQPLRNRLRDPRRFNPTLVRLRRCCGASLMLGSVTFQSHAGSIEAGHDGGGVPGGVGGFNPTLVRLRLGEGPGVAV